MAAAVVVVRIQAPSGVCQCSSSAGDGLQLDGGAGDHCLHGRCERAEHGDRGDLAAGCERGGEQGHLDVDVVRLRGSRRRQWRPGRRAGELHVGDPIRLGALLLYDRRQAVDADDGPDDHEAAAGRDAILQEGTARARHGRRVAAGERVGKQAARGLLFPLQWRKLRAPRAHHEGRQRAGHDGGAHAYAHAACACVHNTRGVALEHYQSSSYHACTVTHTHSLKPLVSQTHTHTR